MDISGTQSNSTLLDAVAAQAQPVAQNNRPAPAPVQSQASSEVTLSRDARERANQPPAQIEQSAEKTVNVADNPVQASGEAQAASEDSRETAAAQSRENENREQQSNVAIQAQATAPTYTARIAAQSYTSVSNF